MEDNDRSNFCFDFDDEESSCKDKNINYEEKDGRHPENEVQFNSTIFFDLITSLLT